MERVLLVNVPSRQGGGAFFIPMGLLYAGGVIERCGHTAKIIDPYLGDEKLEYFENFFDKLGGVIEIFKPNIIGYGGIATSYGRTKRLANFVNNNYSGITQVAGGALASAYRLLLDNTPIEYVFHGEAETSLASFLDKGTMGDGMSTKVNGRIVRNESVQVEDMDGIPFPPYHLIAMEHYQYPIVGRLDGFRQILSDSAYDNLTKTVGQTTHIAPILTSRGCTHKCLFCYRHFSGHRQHSVNYVISHMKYLMETYGVSGFTFADELFNAHYDWVMQFCDEIERNSLHICYTIGGARVNNVDRHMLQRLKDTGCIEISYGQESGSDTVLKGLRKGTTAQLNREVTLLTQEVGILTVVQLVIGSPSEMPETIRETIQFLKDVNAYQFALNYLIPLPETPIWQYVQEHNLIPNEESYLSMVADSGGNPIINFTSQTEKEWRNWGNLIHNEMVLNYYQRNKGAISIRLLHLRLFMATLTVKFIPRFLLMRIPKKIKNFIVGW
jgi:radical SAM superfamily enzyme YgiQ (UPF0313 family)